MNSTTKPSTKKRSIWVIRAGRNGSAHQLFIESGLIALKDQDFGDLRAIRPMREAFYAKYSDRHSDEGRTAIRGIGGKFFRFIHEIQNGDLVLYPCLRERNVYHGQVADSYSFDKSDLDFPHRRKVRWKGCFSKSLLSQSASRELGAARTLFRLKTHADEIRTLIQKRAGEGRPTK
jgi:restriction system protein